MGNVFDPKKQFRGNIKPYLKAIKEKIAEVESVATSVTGTYRGSFATLADINAVTSAKSGDWAIISSDDGVNESGIYVKGPSGFEFVSDIHSFDELRETILATQDEFENPQSPTDLRKAPTLRQLNKVAEDIYAALNGNTAEIVNLNNHKAEKGGSADQAFLVKAGEEASNESVNVMQMTFVILESEASDDFLNA